MIILIVNTEKEIFNLESRVNAIRKAIWYEKVEWNWRKDILFMILYKNLLALMVTALQIKSTYWASEQKSFINQDTLLLLDSRGRKWEGWRQKNKPLFLISKVKI